MTFFLDIDRGLKRRFWAHLLQNELEQAAFVFAKAKVHGSSTTFKALDAWLLPPEDFEVQTSYHIELADSVRGRVIKHAWDTNTCLVEFHSHPRDRGSASFSGSDLAGFDEFVPHCRWRLRGRSYAAILVNEAGVDTLLWHGESQSSLDALRVGWFRRIVPTGRTIRSLNSGGLDRGRRAV